MNLAVTTLTIDNITAELKIQLTIDDGAGIHDAMYFDIAEFQAMTAAQLKAIVKPRVAEQRARTLDRPSVVIPPTDADLTVIANQMEARLDTIYSQLPALKQARIDKLLGG